MIMAFCLKSSIGEKFEGQVKLVIGLTEEGKLSFPCVRPLETSMGV